MATRSAPSAALVPGPAARRRAVAGPARVLALGMLGMVGAIGLADTPAAAASDAPAPLAAEVPAVATPRFSLEGRSLGSGTAFFLAVEREPGAVAVAAAHSFDPGELSQAREVEFRLGRSERRVAVSSRFYARPGRSFAAAGATLRDDFIVFALDAPPRDVRLLEPARDARDLKGRRVRILGVPAAIPQDEDDIFGTVVRAEPERIEVRLDVPVDLRGWGGAPVLRDPEGDVVGILEAAWPDAQTLRLGVAPLGGVLEALEAPLDGGLGRPFAALPPDEAALAAARPVAEPPEPRAETASGEPTAGAAEGAGAAETADEAPVPPLDRPFAVSARRAPTAPPEGESLLGRAGALSTDVRVEIEHPEPGTIVGEETTGAFVSGRALALLGEFRRFDVVLVLDTSGSTAEMTGADINGNGVVGQGGLRGIFGDTDAGDSVLAAEVAAARRILESLDPRSTRVALVTFAGEPSPPPGTIVLGGGGRGRAAITEEPLTTNYARVDRALEHVLERGPGGLTDMAQGVDTAYIELFGFRGGLSEPDPESEKIVLFFTDGQPTLPYDAMFEADNVKAVLRAAKRSARLGVRIHSFAIGPEALEGPVAAVEMASLTGGYFTPVRHPGDLVEVIENVSFSNIASLAVRNLTTGEGASELQTNADGSFGALVPLAPGNNRLEVLARAADGSEGRGEVTVQYAPGAPDPVLSREQMAQRNRLLEQRLLTLRRGRMDAERERAEQARKELQLEIERERSAAEARAAQQRKELDLRVLEEGGAEAGPAERGAPQ